MCLDMDTKVELKVHKPCYNRRSGKLSKCKLRKLLNLSSEQEGLKLWRANVVKATLKKYLRCEQKRRLIAKLYNQKKVLTEKCANERFVGTGSVSTTTQHVCAMAPENTTQYLMDIVYKDMRIETSSSPFNTRGISKKCTQILGHLDRNSTSLKKLTLLLTFNQATQWTLPVSRGRSIAASLPGEVSLHLPLRAVTKVFQVNLLLQQVNVAGCSLVIQ
ncbi:hypothetical protein UPYG_G00348900 [Umbra pygmaea]|uniref:Recombination activating protein 1 n=1 Tax=Umbra pygmaea TaxID=75934 RepID=A0ABD0VZ15_UMBPY